jgi:oligoribonuclease NrnB/cAMP/cGMP phosphodiesterase (DHH superfamily)
VDVEEEEEEDSASEVVEDVDTWQEQEQRKYRGKAKMQAQKAAGKVTPMQLFWQHLMAAKEDAMIRIGEFKKIAEILIVMVAGSIEDERLFSAMSFVLTKHRCSLRESLEKCVLLMTQELFSIDTFPWGAAMEEWHAGASKRGRYVRPAKNSLQQHCVP